MADGVEINDNGLGELLAELPAKLTGEVASIAALEIEAIGTRAFREPGLRPAEWAPLSEKYSAKLKKDWEESRKKNKGRGAFKKQPLITTTMLMKSLRASTSFEDGDGHAATVSSDRKYAAYHQFGGNSKNGKAKPPARPFLPLEPGARGEIPQPLKLSETGWKMVERICKKTIARLLADN